MLIFSVWSMLILSEKFRLIFNRLDFEFIRKIKFRDMID